MHPLCGALPVPYVPVLVMRCAVIVTSVHLYASSLQNLAVSPDFYSLVCISVERSYSDPVFDGVGLAGFKSRANAFLVA